jgi:hypothetical protein
VPFQVAGFNVSLFDTGMIEKEAKHESGPTWKYVFTGRNIIASTIHESNYEEIRRFMNGGKPWR